MGRIVVDEERCKGCEICVVVCPKNVIAMADHFNRQGYRPAKLVVARAKVVVAAGGSHPGLDNPTDESGVAHECTGCTLCARMCPDVAITVYR